jgi:hypothetical protein
MVLAVAGIGSAAIAQTPPAIPDPAATAASAAATPDLAQFAWLRGCWAGKVERREFVESWLPARGGMMVGIGQTVVQDAKDPAVQKTDDYQYLRLEARADGIYYVAIPAGTKEVAFKFTSVGDQLGKKAYTFMSPSDAFPQKIVYLQGSEGWLYAQVFGKVGDNPKEVTYPMRHVDCATGAILSQ